MEYWLFGILLSILLIFLTVFIYANLPTRWTIGGSPPSATFMSEARLVLIRDEHHVDMEERISAKSLLLEKPTFVIVVRRPGCVLCRRHADKMSDLLAEIEQAGMQMIAVVHEIEGVNNFKQYFKGNVFFDDEKRFYGEKQRWLPIWMGMLRIGLYTKVIPILLEGYDGNAKGEGRLLGGVYLIVSGKLAWSHVEEEWGDLPDENEIRQAIEDYGWTKFKTKTF